MTDDRDKAEGPAAPLSNSEVAVFAKDIARRLQVKLTSDVDEAMLTVKVPPGDSADKRADQLRMLLPSRWPERPQVSWSIAVVKDPDRPTVEQIIEVKVRRLQARNYRRPK